MMKKLSMVQDLIIKNIAGTAPRIRHSKAAYCLAKSECSGHHLITAHGCDDDKIRLTFRKRAKA
jgi:adenosine/AMP kinase